MAPRRPPTRPPTQRLVALLAALIVGLAAILTRLALLQVKDAAAFQAMARDQRVRDIPLPAPRGTIFDRNGLPVLHSDTWQSTLPHVLFAY